jgi:hypothetical protein
MQIRIATSSLVLLKLRSSKRLYGTTDGGRASSLQLSGGRDLRSTRRV